MEEHSQISALIRSPGGDELAARMLGHCWPGGLGDDTRPAALDWVRRWGPRGLSPAGPVCSCRTGRCALCN